MFRHTPFSIGSDDSEGGTRFSLVKGLSSGEGSLVGVTDLTDSTTIPFLRLPVINLALLYMDCKPSGPFYFQYN